LRRETQETGEIPGIEDVEGRHVAETGQEVEIALLNEIAAADGHRLGEVYR
jgi:hypothetical protein